MSAKIENSFQPQNSHKNVLIVGSPNSGKTTLYNWLTGSKTKTVNYPGATVEYSVGDLQQALKKYSENQDLQFIDTPGIYSLDPKSEDERVTLNLLKGQNHLKYDQIVLVVDSTQLNRQLLMAKQLLKLTDRVVIVLTMKDLIEKQDHTFLELSSLQSFLNHDNVFLFNGLLGEGLKEIIQILAQTKSLPMSLDIPHFSEDMKLHDLIQINSWLDQMNKSKKQNLNQLDLTRKIDRWLMHPFLGYIFFFVFMTLFFASIYWMAAPLMDLVDGAMSFFMEKTKELIPNQWGEFIADGLLAAVGGVVIFVPQIFILFLGLGLFENTGYLSRVAALIDGPLKKIGLGGRSFLPVLSGFACAIPALMATRNITSKKEKLIAQMIIPIMTCSARLPVFGLMISYLMSDQSPIYAGLMMASLYFLSILVGAIVSGVLSKLIEAKSSSRLLLDLPYYRRPILTVILRQSVDKSIAFIKRAGPVILVLSILLWVATEFPKLPEEATPEQAEQHQSYAMQVANAIEPIFKPMGVDGRVGFALLASFAAREVFVSSLAVSLKADLGDDEENTAPLLDQMKVAKMSDGSSIFTISSIAGILIFFIIATQCLTTVGVLKKETASWKWTLIQLFASNILAYTVAVTVVQVLKLLGY